MARVRPFSSVRGTEKWESNVGEEGEEEGREAAGATVILATTVRWEPCREVVYREASIVGGTV